ncbi:MAG TPA: hypothetical protein VG797_05155 [Phycisphaerales bacterium]|nr:hypothetical protein [Phycisphaerales bacterium]
MPQFHTSMMPIVLATVFVATAFVSGQTTTRVSLASDGFTQGNGGSEAPAVSADGRFVAFQSDATNFVPDDTNASSDIFVHEIQTGHTTRVSVVTGGGQANGRSLSPTISADGRYVAFWSLASNLVAGDTNSFTDAFVHDNTTGETRRVSVCTDGTQANGSSYYPITSGNGRFVAFTSDASNLVPEPPGSALLQIYVHDMLTGENTRVSVGPSGIPGNNTSYPTSISADGRYVGFYSDASNLVLNDTNSAVDAFVHDRQTGQTLRVSVSTDGVQGNNWSSIPTLSADGRFVAFSSLASNLVLNDTNALWDVFVHDMQTGDTRRVSVTTSGGEGYGTSIASVISANGHFVTFSSGALNFVTCHTDQAYDVFTYNLATGVLRRASTITGGAEGNGTSYTSSISADGGVVAFRSSASNLVPGDTNDVDDIFINSDKGPGSDCPEDVNGDGAIGLSDLARIILRWGQSCN